MSYFFVIGLLHWTPPRILPLLYICPLPYIVFMLLHIRILSLLDKTDRPTHFHCMATLNLKCVKCIIYQKFLWKKGFISTASNSPSIPPLVNVGHLPTLSGLHIDLCILHPLVEVEDVCAYSSMRWSGASAK